MIFKLPGHRLRCGVDGPFGRNATKSVTSIEKHGKYHVIMDVAGNASGSLQSI